MHEREDGNIRIKIKRGASDGPAVGELQIDPEALNVELDSRSLILAFESISHLRCQIIKIFDLHFSVGEPLNELGSRTLTIHNLEEGLRATLHPGIPAGGSQDIYLTFTNKNEVFVRKPKDFANKTDKVLLYPRSDRTGFYHRDDLIDLED